MNPHGQKEERKEADLLPHTPAAEIAGACQNHAATPTATRSRQSARGIRVRVHRGGERGLSPTGPGWFDLTHSGWSDQWAQVVIFLNN
jgi:hypothetical protein